MLCLKAEALADEVYPANLVVLPVNLGSSIQRSMHKGGRGRLDPSSSSSDGSTSCCALEDGKSSSVGPSERDESGNTCRYRCQLEKEVQNLQMQLQLEIDLHVALANAAGKNTLALGNSPSKLPDKALELLDNIAALETTVSKLEEELLVLQFRLSRERSERHLAENSLRCSPAVPSELPPSCLAGYTWEEHISSLRDSKSNESYVPRSVQPDLISSKGISKLTTTEASSVVGSYEQVSESCSGEAQIKMRQDRHQDSDMMDLKRTFLTNLWQNPNRLSEEMVRCMRNIFLCLSESTNIPSKVSSEDFVPSSNSTIKHLSGSSLTSFSDSSLMPLSVWSPSAKLNQSCEPMTIRKTFEPYRVTGKLSWKYIGNYSLAAEVSWMSVGKKQLDYAADALKGFRFLVEQLAKVNPALMSSSERLAFWINLYNTLIMHAYLAYGVPRNDIKLFSLMQKASYTVGGQSFSAADIEFVILKMKPPTYRPQIALILALHKFKISEEHRKYSIDSPDPLAVFALSSGMYSSPAVRIFTAENVREELQNSMKDYVQAYVGISEKGKLLVPKLLHCFAKGVVEDSLLVDWICRYLSPDQVSIVRDSSSHRKQRLLGVRSFSIIPFDTRFRYLFLPDGKGSQSSFCGGFESTSTLYAHS